MFCVEQHSLKHHNKTRLSSLNQPTSRQMTVSMEEKILACHLQDEHSVSCNGTIYVLEEKKLTAQDSEFWLYVFGYIFCVLFAGLMSGLTIGLLSLDEISLNVLKEAGSPQQKKYAKRILPIVKRHHLLLVTLVLANSACVEAMPVCLDRVSGPITAILVSTTAVVLFGEVFPQALCTRFGLAIGAYMMPLVYTLMFLLFIVAWPIAKLLDLLLGKEHGTFYRRAELGVLVDLHADKAGGGEEGGEEKLTLDEVLIIKGALEMRDKTAKDAMVPLNDVFMLDINDKMDLLTMNKILTASHSRVPVYDGDKENIIGVLLVKTLITLDPDDKVPIQSLKNTKSWRDVHYIEETKPLYDLLNEYQLGKAHLSVVLAKLDEEEIASATTKQTVLGVITLEDVIEELIQEEIVDETDVYVDIHKRIQVARAKVARNPSLLHKHPRFVERSKSHPPSSAERRVSEDLIDAVSESHRERAASTGNIQTLPERGTSLSNVQTQDENTNVDENNTSSDQNHTKDQSDLPLLNKDVT